MLSRFLMKREPTALCLYLNVVRIWAKVSGFPTYITHGLSESVSGQGPRLCFSAKAPPAPGTNSRSSLKRGLEAADRSNENMSSLLGQTPN